MNTLKDFCNGRFPVGLLYVDKSLWTDEGIAQVVDAGADFITSVESHEPLISLCEKNKLGIISTSNITPMWWGGDGGNAGMYAKEFPLSRLDETKQDYTRSPALWGDFIADEPNSMDFIHINELVKRYKELYRGKLPFINLYPNYGSAPKNTAGEVILQLGNTTYAEYIDRYVREVDLPYISFDFYPFAGPDAAGKYLDNLDTVALACKKSKKEMWVITQAGAWKPDEAPCSYQIGWQVYLCLAFGATAIMHACYSKGWWDEATSCVNLRGEKNSTYCYVKKINSVMHSRLGTEILAHEYLCTRVYGDTSSADERIKQQLIRLESRDIPAELPDIKICPDKAVVAGFFKRPGSFALMLVNPHDPFNGSVSAVVKLEVVSGKILSIIGGDNTAEQTCTPASSSVIITLSGGQGAFVTFTQ